MEKSKLKIGDRIRYKRLDGQYFEGIIIEADMFDKDAYFYRVKPAEGLDLIIYYYKKALDEALEKGELVIMGNGLQKMKRRLRDSK
jgi:hypothetical protein